jgi:argininosuccinate lyase
VAISNHINIIFVNECDLPFRVAHEIYAVLGREAVDAGHGPESIHADRGNAVASARAGRPIPLGAATVHDALGPDACVGRQRHLGGPAPDPVREASGRAVSQVVADRARLEARQAALAVARAELERVLAQIIGDSRARARGRGRG